MFIDLFQDVAGACGLGPDVASTHLDGVATPSQAGLRAVEIVRGFVIVLTKRDPLRGG